MDKPTQPCQIYARALYSLGRGCPLWIPEPNSELPNEYLAGGVDIGDVGILRSDGSFGFIFNACCAADSPINRNRVPVGFQPLVWDASSCHGTKNIFPPNKLIASGGAEIQGLVVEGSASLPGIPVAGGAGVRVKFGQNCGAIIIPPNGVHSRDCESQRLFRDYAARYAISWYELVCETLGMEIENGSIYFVTGFDKTDSWENATFSSSVRDRSFELIVSAGGLVGGRIMLADSSHGASFLQRRSPPGNAYQNQTLFIRGFRVSLPHKIRAFLGGLGVQVTTTYGALFQDALGRKRSNLPSGFNRAPSSTSGPSNSKLGGDTDLSEGSSSVYESSDMEDELSDASSGSGSVTSDTSLDEDDLIVPSEIYHPLKVINDYLLKSTNDIHLVITHDEDWIKLLNSKDLEVPDDAALLDRVRTACHITVKDGCAYLDHVETPGSVLSQASSNTCLTEELYSNLPGLPGWGVPWNL